MMTKESAKNYIEKFTKEFSYPDEAKEALLNALRSVVFTDEAGLKKLLQCYQEERYADFNGLIKGAAALAERAGINPYTAYLLVLILLAEKCEEYYLADGYSRETWRDNFFDLKYKLIECKLVKGVWGTFVPEWFERFYQVRRFTFGLLQFEILNFDKRYEGNKFGLTAKDLVVNIHIPRTGKRLYPQEVDRACTSASRFFKEKFGFEKIIFQCESWLLYPKNKELLSKTSNLYSFISRFTIVGSGEFENYNEVWRLFDCEYTGDVEKLPNDTSFRRAYVSLIQKGEKTGWGYGIYLYGEE